jgi:hypothetical protein
VPSLKQKAAAKGKPFSWSKTQLIAETQTKPDEMWRVELVSNDRGAPYLNLRKWWFDGGDKDWKPSRQGITIHYEMIPFMVNQMSFALEVLDRQSYQVKNDQAGHNLVTIQEETPS